MKVQEGHVCMHAAATEMGSTMQRVIGLLMFGIAGPGWVHPKITNINHGKGLHAGGAGSLSAFPPVSCSHQAHRQLNEAAVSAPSNMPAALGTFYGTAMPLG